MEFNGYGVSLLQGEESSVDWLYSHVKALF